MSMLMIVNHQVYAEDLSSCRKNTVSLPDEMEKEIKEMAKPITAIDWWSANPEQIANRKCKEKDPTLTDIESYLDGKSISKQPQSAKVANVELKGESPELIEAFKNLTSKIDIYGQSKPAEDLQKKYSVNPECHKVKCAAEKVFGKELGDKLLYIKLKSGFNGSELAFDDSSRLNLEETDSLISAIAAYPASRFPLNHNQQLTKFKRGYRLASHNEGVIAFAAITFYDSWTNQTPPMREYTAFHEMGHYIASELDLDHNKAWLGFSGWIEKDGEWTADKKNAVSSKYGAKNPDEDFAESVSAYRYNPQLLREINPEKYQFLKETVFDGLEYIGQDQCSNTQSNILKLSSSVMTSGVKKTPAQLENLLERCGAETRNYLLTGLKNDEALAKCLNKAINIDAMVSNLDKIQPSLKYPGLVKNSILHQQPNLPANSKKFPDDVNAAKLFLMNQFIDDVMAWDKRHYFNYEGTDAAAICKKNWDEYGYQAIFAEKKKLSSATDTYKNRDEFNPRLIELCVKIQSGKKRPKPFKREEVESALTGVPLEKDFANTILDYLPW